jgi:hypothetical protein
VMLALLLALQDAAPHAAWRHVQELNVSKPGPFKIELPVETLDAGRADLADLRLLDVAAREIPFSIDVPVQEPRRRLTPPQITTALKPNWTTLEIRTGTEAALSRLEFSTPMNEFLKGAWLEGSQDGVAWTPILEGQPVFAAPGGASKLHVDFPPGVWGRLRLNLDDRQSPPIHVGSVQLLTSPGQELPTAGFVPEIVGREEEPGRTRIRLRMPGRHLPLASLEIETPEPLFSRRATLTHRSVQGARVSDVVLAQGPIFRTALEGRPAVEQLSLHVDRLLPERELLLSIDNGDSPPLAAGAVRARRRAVHLAASPAASGTLRVISGNPEAAAPRYDIGRLPDLAPDPALRLSSLTPNPAYRAPEALPGLGGPGAPIDAAPWGWRKAVRLGAGALHELELDLDVLSRASPGYADLRLVRDGRQVPFLLDPTRSGRAVEALLEPAPDRQRPRLSRWRIRLPQEGLPVEGLSLEIAESAFQRDVLLLQFLKDERGVAFPSQLRHAVWRRRPGETPRPFSLGFPSTSGRGDLVLEVENGDNPPLTPSALKVWLPRVRLSFKDAGTDGLALYYGNRRAAAPEYDLALAAPQLLAANKVPAELGPEQALAAATAQVRQADPGAGSWLFWGVLGLVSVALLLIVAKLLPAAPPPA